MAQRREYEVVGKFRPACAAGAAGRSKRSGEVHLVKRKLATGEFSCACPGWIHHRRCKHVAYVQRHPYMELTDIPTYQEALAMPACRSLGAGRDFGRNLEAKEQWTIEHLKDVVL